MRLWRFGRHTTAAQPQPAPRARRELGASGTISLDGFLQTHEYNPDLQGAAGLAVYDRMRRSDPAIREALQHIVAPLKNATWCVEPASDDPADLEIAAFVEAAYFRWLNQPFTEYLGQALGYLMFGHMLFETPLQVVEDQVEYTQPEAEQPTVVTRQWLTWRRFAQRMPATIWRWNIKDGELQSVVQNVWKNDGYQEVTIPADNFILFTNEREGDDFTGISILRSAYKSWVQKEIVEKVATVAIERHGVGVPVAYVPESRENDDRLLDRVESMLENLRAGAFNYLVFPGPKSTAGTTGGSGYFFEIVSPPGGAADFVRFLDYLRGEIKGNVLARFAELGHGSTGARATGDVQSEVWYDALQSVANYISDVNAVAIERLVLANYEKPSAGYPVLKAENIQSRNLAEFADVVSKLVASGAIIADPSLRAFSREQIGAPDEDDPEEILQDEEARTPPELRGRPLDGDGRPIEEDNPPPEQMPREQMPREMR